MYTDMFVKNKHENVLGYNVKIGEYEEGGDKKHLPNNILKMVGFTYVLVRISFSPLYQYNFSFHSHNFDQIFYLPQISLVF